MSPDGPDKPLKKSQLDISVSRQKSFSRDRRAHFNKAKWLNLFGQSGTSLLTVALCWPLANQNGLLLFLAIHQGFLLATMIAFALPLGKKWIDRNGMPKMTAPALAVTQTLGGSVMWFDLMASQDLTFALAAFAVTYASAAFTVVTLGPLRGLARLVLFASLAPSMLASLFAGHYLLSYSTLIFLGVVGFYGVSQIHQAYMYLLRLNSQSAEDAAIARELARHDSLTGLLNRVGVSDQFTKHRSEIRSAFFIDLDRFKKVNDEAGHLAGDELLRQVAIRLSRTVPVGTVVSRVGGDEFMLLMSCDDVDQLIALGNETIQRLEESFVLPAGTFSISASIGISLIKREQSLERVFHEADNAMYRAKRTGRGRVMVFTEDMDVELKTRSELEKELVWLIDSGEFPVHGQPIYDLSTGSIRAVEILARPRFRDGSRHLPATILPVVEELQLLDVMTGIILQQAARARSDWRSVEAMKDTAVSINIPPQTLVSDWLVHEVENLIHEYSLLPGDLIFEITEQVLTCDIDQTRETLLALRDLGVKISLDDFGTGYSSLKQLLTFPLSSIKIDRSVIQHVDQLQHSERFMKAIIELASSLGHDVIAEGIETQSQLKAARAAGANLGQGYLLSRPKPLDVLIATIATHSSATQARKAERPKATLSRAVRSGMQESQPVDSVRSD